MKWQYLIIDFAIGDRPHMEITQGAFNEYGKMGWEAVAVRHEKDRYFILFKQPV